MSHVDPNFRQDKANGGSPLKCEKKGKLSQRIGEAQQLKGSNIPPHMKSQKNKTMSIAMGIFVVLTVGFFGFRWLYHNSEGASTVRSEIAMQNKNDRTYDQASNEYSISDEKKMDELDALKEANKVQKEAIRSLQRQLVRSNRKLHEIKAHLFSNQNPEEESRFLSLCHQLVEKEQAHQTLKTAISQMKEEKNNDAETIQRMEETIDALVALTNTQKKEKEQEISKLQRDSEQALNQHQAIHQERFQNKESEVNDLLANINKLQTELEQESYQRQDLEEALKETFEGYESEYYKVQGLEQRLEENNLYASMLVSELDSLSAERDTLIKQQENQALVLLKQQELMQTLYAAKEPEMDLGEDATPVAMETEDKKTQDEQTVRTHAVKDGESLSSISQSYYGTSTRWKEIYEANTDVLKDKNQNLTKGMILKISPYTPGKLPRDD